MLSRLHELDLELFRTIHHGLFGTPFGLALEIIQNGTLGAVVAVAAVLWLWFFGPTAQRRSILLRLIVPVLLAGIAVQGLKHVVNEPRPGSLYPALVLNNDVHLPRHAYSWPSGHATGVFALATAFVLLGRARHRTFPLGERAPKVWLGVSLLTGAVASLTSLGRVVCGAHFPMDVVSGASLGVLVVLLSVVGLDRLEDRVWPLSVTRPDFV